METQPNNGKTRHCLKCGKKIYYDGFHFLCSRCQRVNSKIEDIESRYISHVAEEIRAIRNNS